MIVLLACQGYRPRAALLPWSTTARRTRVRAAGERAGVVPSRALGEERGQEREQEPVGRERREDPLLHRVQPPEVLAMSARWIRDGVREERWAELTAAVPELA